MSERNDLQKRVLFVALAIGLNTLAYSIVFPFLPIYLHTIHGIPMATVGLVFSVMGVATIIGVPLAGVLIDKIGRRALPVGGPAGRNACFFVLAYMASLSTVSVMLWRLLASAALIG